MKSNLTHPSEEKETHLLHVLEMFEEIKNKRVGQFCITDYGVGTCISANKNGKFKVSIAGGGVVEVVLGEITW